MTVDKNEKRLSRTSTASLPTILLVLETASHLDTNDLAFHHMCHSHNQSNDVREIVAVLAPVSF